MIKRVLNIVIYLVIMIYMIIALGFTNKKNSEELCTGLNIVMKDSINSCFLVKPDIEGILLSKDRKILGYPVSQINTRIIESELVSQSHIRNADVYYTNDGRLNVIIEQRKPLVRIITGLQNTYYLDREGYILKEKGDFVPHILIASGYFSDGQEISSARHIDEIKSDEKYKEWKDVYDISNWIRESEFWEKQFVQIYFNSTNEFELIPRVGAHQIIVGDASDFQGKMKKLKTLYTEGLSYEGWNNYEIINLKYKNQVICTKR